MSVPREVIKVAAMGLFVAAGVAVVGLAVREYSVLSETGDAPPREVECTILAALSNEWDRIADFLAGE